MSEWLVGQEGVADPIRSIYQPPDIIGGSVVQVADFVLKCRNLDGENACVNGPFKGQYWMQGLIYASIYNHLININEASCDNTSTSPVVHAATVSSNHGAGANVAMADGHAVFIKQSINISIWRALGTRNGNEAISDSSY